MLLDAGQLNRGGRLVSNCVAERSAIVGRAGDPRDPLDQRVDRRRARAGVGPPVREALQAALRRVGLHRLTASEQQHACEARFAALTGHEAALIATDWSAAVRCLPTWRCAVDARSRALAPEATTVMTPDDAEAVLTSGARGACSSKRCIPTKETSRPCPATPRSARGLRHRWWSSTRWGWACWGNAGLARPSTWP